MNSEMNWLSKQSRMARSLESFGDATLARQELVRKSEKCYGGNYL